MDSIRFNVDTLESSKGVPENVASLTYNRSSVEGQIICKDNFSHFIFPIFHLRKIEKFS